MSLFLIDPEKSYVYVLKLGSKNKYYVGYSSELNKRLDSHIKGLGAEFTKKHGVERLVALIECNDPGRAKELESIITEFYMRVYGKNNVRGAGYTDSTISDENEGIISSAEIPLEETVEKETDKPYNCVECGRPIRHQGRCMPCNIRAKKEREAQG